MKQLDWKSFAIGVLLTTTVMLGTGAATGATEKWDNQQRWDLQLSLYPDASAFSKMKTAMSYKGWDD